MKIKLLTGLLSLVGALSAHAASIYIDPAGGISYAPGVYGPAPGNYNYSVPSGNSAISAAPTGNYYAEVSWGWNAAHNTSVAYSVGATTYQTVNQTVNVNGQTPVPLWSGFKALNADGINFTTGVDGITATANGVGNLTRGIYRMSELGGTLINPTTWGTGVATTSAPGDGKYYYSFPTQVNPTGAQQAFNIGSLLAPGTYQLEISWGVNAGHSAAVDYHYDQTGSGFVGSTLVLTDINQGAMSDGRLFYNQGTVPTTWSGFADLGTFTVEAGSQIWLNKNFGDSGALTMGVLQATAIPESSAVALVGIGLFGLVGRRRRKA
jgi:hypothetical protein